MARIEADFLREMHWGEDVTIITHVVRIGNSSFTVGQEAWQKQQLCAMGTAVHVHYDFSSGKSVSIPPEIRKKLEAHLVDYDQWRSKKSS